MLVAGIVATASSMRVSLIFKITSEYARSYTVSTALPAVTHVCDIYVLTLTAQSRLAA